MPRKKEPKTQVLCTIPLPMPMDQFVETTRALSESFSKFGKTYIRNGDGCYEIFRYVEEDNGEDYPPEPMPG